MKRINSLYDVLFQIMNQLGELIQQSKFFRKRVPRIMQL